MPASAKRILIAPLDWGLGHTTRCVPIIRSLQALGHEVVFAGDKKQQSFIRQSFPQIDVRFLQGYRVRYSRYMLMFTLLWQLPRLLNTIRKEHQWLKDILSRENIDGIISDNRYGLWNPKKPSVIMTHQPAVMSGLGAVMDARIRYLHYRYLSRFRQVWIPDLPGQHSLAGQLSHPSSLPRNCRYIGWLTQFKPREHHEKKDYVLILLSGPEPQRTMLADKLWEQAKMLMRRIVFVEGREGITRTDASPLIRHIALAGGEQLQSLIEEAALVICRSGYSTLMDLALLGKQAVLIPTPGQTEQEYLARYLAAQNIFYTMPQKDFSLSKAITLVESGHRRQASVAMKDEDLLMPVLEQWLEGL